VHSLGDARELRRSLVVEGDMERAWDARDRRERWAASAGERPSR
jgi:hypothetical protein